MTACAGMHHWLRNLTAHGRCAVSQSSAPKQDFQAEERQPVDSTLGPFKMALQANQVARAHLATHAHQGSIPSHRQGRTLPSPAWRPFHPRGVSMVLATLTHLCF